MLEHRRNGGEDRRVDQLQGYKTETFTRDFQMDDTTLGALWAILGGGTHIRMHIRSRASSPCSGRLCEDQAYHHRFHMENGRASETVTKTNISTLASNNVADFSRAMTSTDASLSLRTIIYVERMSSDH